MHGLMNVELVRLTSVSSRGGVIRGANSVNMHHVIKIDWYSKGNMKEF